MADETVRLDVQINARAAIKELRDMTATSYNLEEAVKRFGSFLVNNSKKWGVPIAQLRKEFQALNAELMRREGAGIFKLDDKNFSTQEVFKLEKGFTAARQAAGGFQTAQDGVVTSINRGNKAYDNADRAARGYGHGIDIVRTALGTLAAVGIFSILSFITKTFQEATKAARELEQSLFRLSNAERILSQEGAEVSLSGLKKGIQEIKDLFPIFSKEDITQLVAQVSIGTKELGLTEQQIIEVSKAIALLNIRSTEEETAAQTAQKVIQSIVTSGKGIGSLAVSFSEATLRTKGFELGILKAGQGLEGLSDKERGLIKVAVLLENTGQEASKLGDYMETNDAIIRQNNASWHDLLTTIGSFFTALTPLLSPVFESAEKAANGFKLATAVVMAFGSAVSEVARSIQEINFLSPVERAKKVLESFRGGFADIFQKDIAENIQRLFPEIPSGMSEQFQNIIGSYIGDAAQAETATGQLQDSLDSIDTSKAQEELKDLLKDLEELKDKMAEKEADFQLDLERFDQDALIDQQRSIEDYNLNVLQATRAFNLQRQDYAARYRQRELEDERKFQEALRQLQENFLYNLEDALRERDARQVLRLIDKYNMEKQNLINENNLRRQAAEENRRLEEADRLAQFQEKLRVMAEEQALEVQRMNEDSALKRQRMEEDHAIEMERLKEQLDERIQQAAEKMAEEYGVNEEGAKAIYELLKQYYGTDGALAQLTSEGYNAMLGQATGFLSTLASIIAQYQGMLSQVTIPPISPYTNPGGGYIPPGSSTGSPYSGGAGSGYIPGFAKGGQFVATRPQKIQVGEGGEPELVTITPLSQLIEQNATLNGKAGENGVGGETKVSVMVDLSPDLEARIVNKSLDGAAQVISQVRRGK